MLELSEWHPAAKAAAGLVGAALAVALWSVLASVVFLAGTGLLRADGLGLLGSQWWLYWWFYGFDHRPVVGPWLVISGGAAAGVPALLLALGLLRRGLPGGVRELHGTTQWAPERVLGKEFRTRFAGLYIGYTTRGFTGRRRYLRFGGPEHVACYAPTRSGKGVGLVIPNCLLYEASLVCLDVKKENWAASAGIRKAAGQKVFLFDPLSPDNRTARYNPLSYVRRGTVDTFDDVQRVGQMLFPHADGDQAFWVNSARSAFVGATALLAETPDARLTIGEVLRLLSRHDSAPHILGMIEARRSAGTPYTAATVLALTDYLSGSADTVQGIRKTVTSALGLWFNPRIDAATSESDFDLRELRNGLHAIYVGVTPDNIARLRPLLALFFQQLVDLTVRTLPQFDPQAKHQVLVLLDEFPLLGPMPVLADAFAFVAGYGMRLMLIMQSKAQLRDPALYGPDKAAAILDNCGVEVVFGSKDLQLTKELSERLGFDTVDGISRSGPRFWRLFRNKGQNTTESDQRRALLLPQEVARLKPRDAIVIRPGMLPIKCKRIRYYADRTFARLVRKPPVVQPIEVVQLMDAGPAAPSAPAAPPPAPVPSGPATPPPDLHIASPSPAAAASPAPAPAAAEAPGRASGVSPMPAARSRRGAAAPKVETVNLRRTGPDFAFADVRLAGVNLHGLRVFRRDGAITLRPPEQIDAQGKARPMYVLQPGWTEAIAARIAELWDHADASDGAGTPARVAAASPASAPTTAAPDPEADPGAPSPMQPHQADALVAGIVGIEVDLSGYGLADAKAVVAELVKPVPTVGSLNRRRKGAAA